MPVIAPQFSGVIIKCDPVKKPGCYRVQFTVVPDYFAKGIYYNRKSKDSLLADQLTAELEEEELKGGRLAIDRFYYAERKWSKPARLTADLGQLVDGAPMPRKTKKMLKDIVSRLIHAKLLTPSSFGSLNGENVVFGDEPDMERKPFLTLSLGGWSSLLPENDS